MQLLVQVLMPELVLDLVQVKASGQPRRPPRVGSAAFRHSSISAPAWTPPAPRAYAPRQGQTPLAGLRRMPGPHHGGLPPTSPVEPLGTASAPFTGQIRLRPRCPPSPRLPPRLSSFSDCVEKKCPITATKCEGPA